MFSEMWDLGRHDLDPLLFVVDAVPLPAMLNSPHYPPDRQSAGRLIGQNYVKHTYTNNITTPNNEFEDGISPPIKTVSPALSPSPVEKSAVEDDDGSCDFCQMCVVG